jgi:tRNA(fMet)-specific endonuclease VapC
MGYLFDTSILAEVLRASPSRPLVRRLTTVPTKDRWTSVVTVTQLLVAARKAQTPRIMQTVVQLVAAVRVAPFDLAAAQTYAKLRASVAEDLHHDDVMIAAIAITQGFVVVTKRPREFSAFHQLRVEDWTRG